MRHPGFLFDLAGLQRRFQNRPCRPAKSKKGPGCGIAGPESQKPTSTPGPETLQGGLRAGSYRDTSGALRGSNKGPVPIETLLGPSRASQKGRFLSKHFWGPPRLQKRAGPYRDTSGAPWGAKQGPVPIETLLGPSRASKKGRFPSRHFWGPAGLQNDDNNTDDNNSDDVSTHLSSEDSPLRLCSDHVLERLWRRRRWFWKCSGRRSKRRRWY